MKRSLFIVLCLNLFQLSHVLEHDFLDEQVNAIKDIADKIRQLKRAGSGLGEYLFDQKL